MKWAVYSPGLTAEARKSGELLDKRSKIGLRRDGTRFVKLFGVDMTLQRERVIERDGRKCSGCGRLLGDGHAELDHKISRGKGGDDSMTNLQLLGGPWSVCKCHQRKHLRILNGKVNAA